MKKTIFAIIFAMLLLWCTMGVCNAATTLEGSCGENATYTVNNNVLTISGTGYMYDYYPYSSDIPWYSSRSTITKIVVNEGITYIGSYAFSNFPKLTEVSLPKGIIGAGRGAFRDCTSLKSLEFKDGFTYTNSSVFANCSALEYVSFPASYTSWSGNESLPASVIIKGYTNSGAEYFAMENGHGFESVGILAGETVAEGALSETIEWRLDSTGLLTVTGEGAMPDFADSYSPSWESHRAKIRKVIIGEGITHLADYSFPLSSYNVVSITLPETLESIGKYSLAYCKAHKVYIPPSVVSIHSTAMYGIFDTAIVGYTYSFAHEFATNNNITFESLGELPPAYYEEGTLGANIIWNFDNRGKLTVTGEGAMPDFASENDVPWSKWINSVKSLVIEGELTNIGAYSFANLRKITEVTIPEGVEVIGERAFFGCSKITKANLPESVKEIKGYAFYACTSLGSLTNNATVEKIGDYAFYDCPISTFRFEEGLMSIGSYAFADTYVSVFAAPSTLNSIGEYAFYKTPLSEYSLNDSQSVGKYAFAQTSIKTAEIPTSMIQIPEGLFMNTQIKELEVPSQVTKIDVSAFEGCTALMSVAFNENLLEIGNSAFRGCKNITAVVIPDRVELIGNGAFAVCENITELSIGSGVKKIGSGAFSSNTALKSVVIPDSVKEIGSSVFYSCSMLESVVLPKGITAIPDSAFKECKALSSIVLHEGITSIGVSAFYNALTAREIAMPSTLKSIGDEAFKKSKITGLTLNDGLEELGERAFSESNITSVTIPGSVRSIGVECFYMAKLKTVVVENGVEEIGNSAFKYTAIRAVTIPGSVKRVGYNAFYSCSSLAEVIVEDGVEEIDEYAFGSCKALAAIEIAETVSYIYRNAFYNASAELVIKGYEKSLAQWYADKYGYSFESLGEASGKVIKTGEMTNGAMWSLSSHGVLSFDGEGNKVEMAKENNVKLPWNYCPDYISAIAAGHGISKLGGFPPNNEANYFPNVELVEISSTVLVISSKYATFDKATVFKGYEGSAAETFAKGHGYSFVSLGKAEEELVLNGEYENVKWSISSCGILTLEGEGAVPEAAAVEWREYAEAIKGLVVKEGITKLDDYLFISRDYDFETIVLPCSLGKINIPYSAYSGATVYGYTYSYAYDAFGYNKYTTFVSLGVEPLKVRDEGAFGDNFTWRFYNHRILEIEGNGSMGDMSEAPWTKYSSLIDEIKLMGNITSIGKGAFSGTSITEFTIPKTVTKIEAGAFSDSDIKEIVIPETVKELGGWIFIGCQDLESVWIYGDSVNITEQMFESCYALKHIQLPKNTSIEWNSFNGADVKYIYYQGSESDFAKYVTGSEYLPENAVIYYSSTLTEEVYVKDIRITKSTKGANVRLTAKLRGGEAAFIAGYDKDGAMVSLTRLVPYENQYSIEGDISEVKVFFWKGEATLLPINEVYAETIN